MFIIDVIVKGDVGLDYEKYLNIILRCFSCFVLPIYTYFRNPSKFNSVQYNT